MFIKKPITVLWAILVKDGSKVLDLFFECLLVQDFPLKQVYLYVRTNDNNDNTSEKLKHFLETYGDLFGGYIYDDSSVNYEVKKYSIHEWNPTRFKLMAEIRQASLNYAKEQKHDFYFTSDVDNFLLPSTLSSLVQLNVTAVAPLLKMVVPPNPRASENCFYSTFHHKIAKSNGQFVDSRFGRRIATQDIQGIFEVDLIHCTYLLRQDVFSDVNYSLQDGNWEYRNFALSLQKNGIPQYVDAREVYGCLTLSESVDLARKIMTELETENVTDENNSLRGSIFDVIYRSSAWGKDSGPGSDPTYAKYWIDKVNSALSLPDIDSVLDIGSGDWRLGSNYNLKNKSYTGLEVSEEAIKISEKYTSTKVNFVFGDAEHFVFSRVDLILVKDVLQHLPSKSVQIILDKIFKACKFALICNDFSNINVDIHDGGWRSLNLNEKPFNSRLIEVGCFGKVNQMKKQVYLYVADSIKGTDHESEMLIRLGLDSRSNA